VSAPPSCIVVALHSTVSFTAETFIQIFSSTRSFIVREASSSFLRFRDTVRQKLLINHLRGGTLRSTLGLPPPYAVSCSPDYEWYSVERPRNLPNDMKLTIGRGSMSNVVFGTLFGHHIPEVGSKISGRMSLEQIV
jgi:hypothetical protein